MFKVIQVKMNYMDEAAGVVKMPVLSWQLSSDKRNISQKAYKLQLAEDETFFSVLYDSGVVDSGESLQADIENFVLQTAARYFVRVKVQDNENSWSEWSLPVSFVSGLVDNNWRGIFISAETEADADQSKGTYLRKDIYIGKKVKEAYAYTTALGLYHFFINGQKVGADQMTPGWTSYQERLLYQTYDVTRLLQEGANTLGTHLGAGWYKGLMGFNHIRNIYGKVTAFLAQVHVKYEDGTEDIFVTDESWQGSDSPVIFSEIYDGEIYDATLEQDGWSCAGFDCSLWHGVNIVEYEKVLLQPQYASRPGVNDRIPAKRIFTTPKGETVVDFGQNMTGWIEFSVDGKRGDKVQLKCFEVLDSNGNAYFANLRAAKETVIYICKGDGKEVFHPSFTFQGFQFAQIVEYPGAPQLENFIAYTVHSVMESTGSFECSNQDITQLQHNILWGLKGNFLDVPTDCPQRDERLGWTGDAQIFCRTACFLKNTYAFYEKWLKDVAADQTEEGGVPHVVPDLLTGDFKGDWLLRQGTHSAAAWADAAVVVPWTVYLTYGDKNIIRQQYVSMKKWVDFMHSHAENGIWKFKLQFGDWVALDAEEGSYFGATPNELVCSAYYAYSTLLFAKMAKAIGKDGDYEVYLARYNGIKRDYQQNFFDNEGNLKAQTQTAHVVSLYFDLVREKYKAKIAANLVKLIQKENGHLVTGFVGTPYICHALSQNGYVKEAYDLLLKDDFPSWLYQVKRGATTIWEHWDGLKPDGTMWSADMNSFNHYAYGAIGEWLYRAAAGIEIDENAPGYKHILLKPLFGGGLSYVKAAYQSVYGEVGIHWQLNGKKGSIKINVPVNTTATLYLADVDNITDSEGLAFEKYDRSYKASTGSGEYTINFTLA
ncbi:bacterial alpha-l-rhamnosidase [Lucifera butyrica]|uniref:alpha-L-rhamnosidase n=1 Tax=Lucifera butyrica TaxID=1351585 RepID=A0A498R3F1_9FIRM|nr:alpha-L-rhamnosidase [Lucifera butyrica]VBB07186.1 bacterial alpha-l-rhamnosidase [Lucifera butyrica]